VCIRAKGDGGVDRGVVDRRLRIQPFALPRGQVGVRGDPDDAGNPGVRAGRGAVPVHG